MTDRELLEPAAKAAGYDINFEDPINDYYVNGYDSNGDPHSWWNPLIDDGDALRLAVDLKLDILHYFDDVGVDEQHMQLARCEYGSDPRAATRLAIVCAAAEIGKAMP